MGGPALIRLLAVAAVLCHGAWVAEAQETADPVARPAPTTPVQAMELAVIDPAAIALETHADGLFGGLMRERRVPGAVLVVVEGGRVLLAKGYGHADVDRRLAVDPARTQFRVASISKLFTAIAAMQQVEAGRLVLEADVNTVLTAFTVPEIFPAPVTLAHLLTHTAGFDDRFRGCCRWADGNAYTPLGAYLAASMPPRVMPPGQIISYSNHGYALIGHLAEVAAGEAFVPLTRARILDPLGMSATRWGLSEGALPDLAVPYRHGPGGAFLPRAIDINDMVPTAELVTTGADMARFMLALLKGGSLDGVQILRPETLDLMMRTQFRNAEGLDGWGYGFHERTINGWRTLGHDGSWGGFGALMLIAPEADTGIFLATNIDYDPAFFHAALFGLADRLLPVQGALRPASTPAATGPSAAAVAGVYVPNRRVRGDFMKLGALLGSLTLEAQADGTLVSTGDPLRALLLRPAGPGLWRDEERQVTLAALTDSAGAVTGVSVGQFAFDRAPLAMTAAFTWPLLGAALLAGLATLAVWGVWRPLTWLAGRAGPAALPLPYRLAGVCASACTIVFVIGFAAQLGSADQFTLLVETPPALTTIGWLVPVLAVLAVLLLGWGGWLLAQGGAWGRRIAGLAPGLAAAAIAWFGWYWNAHPWGL